MRFLPLVLALVVLTGCLAPETAPRWVPGVFLGPSAGDDGGFFSLTTGLLLWAAKLLALAGVVATLAGVFAKRLSAIVSGFVLIGIALSLTMAADLLVRVPALAVLLIVGGSVLVVVEIWTDRDLLSKATEWVRRRFGGRSPAQL